MIEWVCDSCRQRLEHEAANPPKGWASIQITVTWPEECGNSQWESDQVVLCKLCRTASGDKLEAIAVEILRKGFQSRPLMDPSCK